jgi:hypothetical protein
MQAENLVKGEKPDFRAGGGKKRIQDCRMKAIGKLGFCQNKAIVFW